MTVKKVWGLLFALMLLLFLSPSASATERLCDVSFEDCRAPLLQLINNENQEIDVAFWLMDDSQIITALTKAKARGVPVRMLVDPRADEAHTTNTATLATFAQDGFLMRNRSPFTPSGAKTGILHWKMMLFSGQGVVEFSGANFSQAELIPFTRYVNYTDEAIYFSDDPNVVNSFRVKYDDWWTNTDTTDTLDYTGAYTDYMQTSPITLMRSYSTFPIDPELDFLPTVLGSKNDYGTRSQAAINAEKVKLDIDMFRITNKTIANTTINAFNRHLPVRMIVDSSEYRNPARVWNSFNIDRLFMAGIPIKTKPSISSSINHEKSLLLYGQGMTIFGSSNWSAGSFNFGQEHNYFPCSTTLAKQYPAQPYPSPNCFYVPNDDKPRLFQWFVNQFERRWNSPKQYPAFVPQPPSSYCTAPCSGFFYNSPGNGASSISTTVPVTLKWEGGPWAQQYDIYFGTANQLLLLASNVGTCGGSLAPGASCTGAPDNPNADETFKVSGLAPNKTYVWKIVSKTMANLSQAGGVWSFTTATTAPAAGATVSSITPASGPSSGGTPVTITGTNFPVGTTPTVSFGFSAATNVVVKDNMTITAKTPYHVGSPTGITTGVSVNSGTPGGAFMFIAPAVSTVPRLNVVAPDTSYQGGGDTVTIAGSNLSGATVCFWVGGNCTQLTPIIPPPILPCPSTVCIEVTVPNESAGTTASIVVSTPSGSSNSLSFKYVALPAPTITAISPSSGTMNGGTQLVISGSGFRYGAVVSFGGPPPPIGTGTLATTIAVSYSAAICGSGVALPCIIATTPPFAIGSTEVVVTNINPATGVIDSGSGISNSGSYTYTQ